MQFTARIGVPVPASAILYEAVQFALAVAEESGGAFDPTIGYSMEMRGFNREYSTGRIVQTALEPGKAGQLSGRPPGSRSEDDHARSPADPRSGAVAKGLAIDMAAHELKAFEDYAIDAGGDLYRRRAQPERRAVVRRNPSSAAWRMS